MQKLILSAIAIAMMATPLAAAESYSGSVLVGHPLTLLGIGVTEIADGCDPDGAAAGVDGTWFDISADAGTVFTLTMDASLDADVYFYDAGCAWINDNSGAANGLGQDETGALPAGAAFAVVNGYQGSGSFTLTIS